jgi:hypothetical protein
MSRHAEPRTDLGAGTERYQNDRRRVGPRSDIPVLPGKRRGSRDRTGLSIY